MTATRKRVKKRPLGHPPRHWAPKHEIFAQAICAGSTPHQAYILAGQPDSAATPGRARTAYDWINWPPMVTRIKEITAARVARLSLDRDKMILKLLDTYELATAEKQHMAAVKALDQMIKMLDLYPTEKQQLEVTLISKPAPEPTKQIELSVDDWKNQFSPKEITQQ